MIWSTIRAPLKEMQTRMRLTCSVQLPDQCADRMGIHCVHLVVRISCRSLHRCRASPFRLCVNKLGLPVDGAAHYIEATRAFMVAEEYGEAFQCLQRAVQARLKPHAKQKDKADLTMRGIAVASFDDLSESPDSAPLTNGLSTSVPTSWTLGSGALTPIDGKRSPQAAFAATSSPADSTSSPLFSPAQSSSSYPTPASAFLLPTSSRSPAFTAQAGTIALKGSGRALYLSPETMQAPISSGGGALATATNQQRQPTSSLARTASIQPRTATGKTIPASPATSASSSSSGMVFSSMRSSTPSSTPASPDVSPPLPPSGRSRPVSAYTSHHAASSSAVLNSSSNSNRSRPRRHSLSTPSTDLLTTAPAMLQNDDDDSVIHHVLYIDLLLARLAVQLGADLWADLEFRHAVLALEMACTLFACLLIAERKYATAGAAGTGAPFQQRSSNLIVGVDMTTQSVNGSNSGPASATQTLRLQDLTTLSNRGVSGGDDSTASSPNSNSPVAKGRGGMDSSRQFPLRTNDDESIERRLAGLLGPHAYNATASSQTLGALTLGSSRPIYTKPIPSFIRRDTGADDTTEPSDLVLYAIDPHASVSEGEALSRAATGHGEPMTSILEESLVCRWQLATYYVNYDEELTAARNDNSNGSTVWEGCSELRRAKALYEQVAMHRIGSDVLGREVDVSLVDLLAPRATQQDLTIDHIHSIAALITGYAEEDEKLHLCLFLAGLADALIGIRTYMAYQAWEARKAEAEKANQPPKPSTNYYGMPKSPAPSSKKPSASSSTPSSPSRSNRRRSTASSSSSSDGSSMIPPPIPELYLLDRPVWCPPILKRYRAISPSFGLTPEIRLLRSINGLLLLAANLTARVNETLGAIRAPKLARQLFQAAWGQELMRELQEVLTVFHAQRPLTNTAAKLMIQIKAAMKEAITPKS